MNSIYISSYKYKDINKYGKRSFLKGLQSSSTCNYTPGADVIASKAI